LGDGISKNAHAHVGRIDASNIDVDVQTLSTAVDDVSENANQILAN